MSEKFIDNRKVSGNHQRGIERVMQRGKGERTSQSGEMHMKSSGGSFKRSGGSLTPRKA